MKDVKEIREVLRSKEPYLRKEYKVKSLGLFGSYVRDEATEDSDVDILVEYSEVPDLIDFIELREYLSNLLRAKVDLVMKDTLKPNIGEKILEEALYL